MTAVVYGNLRFECTRCGACCKRRGGYAYVYLSDAEVEALSDFLGVTDRTFRKRYTFVDELGWTQIRFEGDVCPFLEPATASCGVYPVRPTQCSTFPFWREFVVDGGWTPEAVRLCEGVGSGELQDARVVEANMRAMEEWDEEETSSES